MGGTEKELKIEKKQEKTEATFQTDTKFQNETKMDESIGTLPPQSLQQKQSGWNEENYGELKERVKAGKKARVFFLGKARETDTENITPLEKEKEEAEEKAEVEEKTGAQEKEEAEEIQEIEEIQKIGELQNKKEESDKKLMKCYDKIAGMKIGVFSFRYVIRMLGDLVDFLKQNDGHLADSEAGSDKIRKNISLLERVHDTASTYIEKHQDSRWKIVQERVNLVRLIQGHVGSALMSLNESEAIFYKRLDREEERKGIKIDADLMEDNQPLTEEEKKAISLYTRTGNYKPGGEETDAVAYQWINGLMRGTKQRKKLPRAGRKELDQTIKTLDKMLGNAVITGKTRLYRGADLVPVFGKAFVENPENLIGKVISDKGYTSTSLDKGVADRFIKQDLENYHPEKVVEHYVKGIDNDTTEPFKTSDCLLEITARKGAHGKKLPGSQISNESEVLFARDTKMLIRNVKTELRTIEIKNGQIREYLRKNNVKESEDRKYYDARSFKPIEIKVLVPVLQVDIQ